MKTRWIPRSASHRVASFSGPTRSHFRWVLPQRTTLTLLLGCVATATGATVIVLFFSEADKGLDSNYPMFVRGMAVTPLSRTASGLETTPGVRPRRTLDTAPGPVRYRLGDHSVESAPPSNASWTGLTFTPGIINTALNFTASQLQM